MDAADWLLKRAELTPTKLAVVDESTGLRFTYLDMHNRAEKLAAYLHGLGIEKGDRIAFLAVNRLEHLDALFAAQKLGAIFVPVNFRLSVKEIGFILQDCAPKVLFYDTAMAETVTPARTQASIKTFVALDSGASSGTGNDPTYELIMQETSYTKLPQQINDLEIPWLILYTGGTTGFPKGAVLSQRMVTWNAVNTVVSWGLEPSDIAPIFTPFFHTGGLNVLTTPLIHLGGTLVITGSFRPGEALHVLSREKATIAFMIPTMFQMMSEEPDFATEDLGSIRFCISGGAPCPQTVYNTYWQRGLVFKQGYGLTEVGPNCFALDLVDVKRKPGSVGKPVFHSMVKLVNDSGREVDAGQVGEILIRGNHLSTGYWQNPQATATAFRGGWFCTGDLARRDEEGYYYIVDRKKDMIISGGENVYPTEIESILLSHPDIVEVAVVGIPHAKWGEVAKCFVVLKTGVHLTAEDIISYCRHNLASYKTPKAVEFLAALPRNAAGKVIKRELR